MTLILTFDFSFGEIVTLITDPNRVPRHITSIEIHESNAPTYWVQFSDEKPRPFYAYQIMRWEDRYKEVE